MNEKKVKLLTKIFFQLFYEILSQNVKHYTF